MYHLKYNRLGLKLGFSIAKDAFDYGLTIPHYGTIIVGSPNSIGKFAVLQSGICISGNGKIIGDGLYMATGAKITSKTVLGNNISVAANSVVTKSFEENDLSLAGMLAEIIKTSPAWYIRDGQEYTRRVQAVENLKQQKQIY